MFSLVKKSKVLVLLTLIASSLFATDIHASGRKVKSSPFLCGIRGTFLIQEKLKTSFTIVGAQLHNIGLVIATNPASPLLVDSYFVALSIGTTDLATQLASLTSNYGKNFDALKNIIDQFFNAGSIYTIFRLLNSPDAPSLKQIWLDKGKLLAIAIQTLVAPHVSQNCLIKLFTKYVNLEANSMDNYLTGNLTAVSDLNAQAVNVLRDIAILITPRFQKCR